MVEVVPVIRTCLLTVNGRLFVFGICRIVRVQAMRSLETFVKRVEKLIESMVSNHSVIFAHFVYPLPVQED